MPTNLDLDCLRTFVAIAECGSFARAGERVGRSLSAVSQQVDKLEEQVGVELFRKDGRRRLASTAGRQLLDHARAILAANDAALTALKNERLQGPARIGLLHDVLELAVAEALGQFAIDHPHVRLEVSVDTSRALIDALEAGQLDQAIAFQVETRLPSEIVTMVPMVWIAARPGLAAARKPLPLVLLDDPCKFRRAGLGALDDAGIDRQITLVSPSLGAVRAAVSAGLGVTVRTPHFAAGMGSAVMVVDSLPKLPAMPLCHYRRPGALSATGAALKAACLARLLSRQAPMRP